MRVGYQRRVVVVVLVAVALTCAALLFACVVHGRRLDELVAAELARIRSQGYPVTLEELDAWYPSPPAEQQNAADVYEEAFASLSYDSESVADLLSEVRRAPPSDKLSDPTREHVLECLDANRESLRLLHAGSTIEHCRYWISLSKASQQEVAAGYQGPDDPQPNHVAKAGCAGRLLWLEARLNMRLGQSDAAAESLAAIMALGNSLSMEPLWASQVARAMIHYAGIVTLQRGLSESIFSQTDLHKVVVGFDRAESPESWLRAAVGERCLGLRHYSDRGGLRGSSTWTTPADTSQSGRHHSLIALTLTKRCWMPSETGTGRCWSETKRLRQPRRRLQPDMQRGLAVPG